MIVIPAPLRSDFIHMAGMTIHIALESTIHIVGIRTWVDFEQFFERARIPIGGEQDPRGRRQGYRVSAG
jgi:hypothetical protein